MAGAHFIGLMSGTSLDGVDAVLARWEGNGRLHTVAALTHPFPNNLRHHLACLCESDAPSLEFLLNTDRALAELYAQAVKALIQTHPIPAGDIRAVGCHGQTIRHLPAAGTTLQIGNPARLAELTHLTVVADFRHADLAAGGQGAPLAPLFHQALLWEGEDELVVVNIGGMANLSLIGPGILKGFDSGPGNVLLDAWAARHLGTPWDEHGAFAASGSIHPELLAILLDHPYFSRPPPKSTGREDFHLGWLDTILATLPPLPIADVQATLSELTARTIADAVKRSAPRGGPVLLCGGGVHNHHLTRRLIELLAPRTVESTAHRGVDPDQLEALGFAWLAAKRLAGEAVDTRPVTGARHPVILGAVYRPPPG